MFLAGLQSIPSELYEAAGMDGAGPFRRLLTITIPGLWPIIRTMAILSFIWNFHAFNQFYVLLGGDASSAAAVPNLVIMREAFTNLYYSLGSAMSTLLLSVILLAVGLVIARRGRGDEE
jgi:multiple sugar transport system permease protein